MGDMDRPPIFIDETKFHKAAGIRNKKTRIERLEGLLNDSGVFLQITSTQDEIQQPSNLLPAPEVQMEDPDASSDENESNSKEKSASDNSTESTESNTGQQAEPMALDETELVDDLTLRESDIDYSGQNVNYSQPIRREGQQRGAYARMKEPCQILIQFADFLQRRNGDKFKKKRRSECSKYLAYSIESYKAAANAARMEQEEDGEGFDPDEAIKLSELIDKKFIVGYIERAEERLQGESIRAAVDSLKYFVEFMRLYSSPDPHLTLKLAACTEAIRIKQKKNRKKIKREKAVTDALKFSQVAGKKLSDVWSMFSTEFAKKRLQDVMHRIKNGRLVSFMDYHFLLCYCAAVISLYYGLRPEVIRNMRIGEWNKRKTYSDGIVAFGIKRHKNKAVRKFQPVVLTREHADIFQFYLDYARRCLIRKEEESENDPFFIKFDQTEIEDSAPLIKSYQVKVKAPCKYTNRDVRHIIETQSYETFTTDKSFSDAISKLLGHKPKTAIRAYVDFRSDFIIKALIGLRRMAGEEDGVDDLANDDGDGEEYEGEQGDRGESDDEEENEEDDVHVLENAERVSIDQGIPSEEGDLQDEYNEDRRSTDALFDEETEAILYQPPMDEDDQPTNDQNQHEPQGDQVDRSADRNRKTVETRSKKAKRRLEEGYSQDPNEKEDLPPAWKILKLIETQEWPYVKESKKLPGRGRGLLAAKYIPSGAVICDYNGHRMRKQEHENRMKRFERTNMDEYKLVGAYALEEQDDQSKAITEKFVIEAHDENRPPKSFGRLINHSKKHPNCKPRRFEVEKAKGKKKVVVLFTATKRIKKGEELLFTYGKYFKDEPWFKKCPCGLEKCRVEYEDFVQSTK